MKRDESFTVFNEPINRFSIKKLLVAAAVYGPVHSDKFVWNTPIVFLGNSHENNPSCWQKKFKIICTRVSWYYNKMILSGINLRARKTSGKFVYKSLNIFRLQK